jgi:predicted acyltransferase
MPLFLFITGCSMVFSFEKRLLTQSKVAIYGHVLKRVAILWVLGMVVQGNLLDFKWERLVFFSNTLQSIAIGYLGSSLILMIKDWRLQVGTPVLLIATYWSLLHFAEKFVYELKEPAGDYYLILVHGFAIFMVWGLCYVMYRKRLFIKI